MIRAIIFDLGGVLFTNGTDTFVKELSRQYQINEETVRSVIGNGPNGNAYREGKIGRDEFWKNVLSELNIHADIDRLEEEWIDMYKLIHETREIIKDLSKKYKVYYLSDNVRERVEKLNSRHQFLKWFEDGIFAHEIGIKKPNPEVYRAALKKAGVSGNEAVFVDDKQTNLPPAESLGMKTILFKSPEKLKRDLQKISLL